MRLHPVLALILASACVVRTAGDDEGDATAGSAGSATMETIPPECEGLVVLPTGADVLATHDGDAVRLSMEYAAQPVPGCEDACTNGWSLDVLVPTDVVEETLDLGELEATAEYVTAHYDDASDTCTCKPTSGEPEGGLVIYHYDGSTICGHLSPTAVLNRSGDFWASVD